MEINSEKLINYKFFLVDLDNTLYRYDICHKFALKSVYNKMLKDKKIFNEFDDFLKDYKESQVSVKRYTKNMAASHSRLLYFQDIVEKKFNNTDVRLITKLEKRYWEYFFSKMKINKKLVDLLWLAKKNGSKICIITNLTSNIQFKKIIKLKLEKLIDYIVTSEEAGIEKPSSLIFKKAMDKMGADKSLTLIIGDEPVDDRQGAEKLKINYLPINIYN